MSDAEAREGSRMKIRQPAGALLFVTLFLILPVGYAEAADPLPDAQSHILKNGFRNTNPAFTPPGPWERMKFIGPRLWATTVHPRSVNLPRVENDGTAFKNNRTAATVTWVGHSTLLLQLDGVNILTDPHWSDRASPVGFAGPRRVTPPGLKFEDLPPIHIVLISHDHYDHLDEATVKRLARAHQPLFLVPLGLRAWFAEIGITEVEELDWWQGRAVSGLTLTAVPAQHFSGRTPWDRNRRLWSGWTLAGRAKRLYFAGDTAYYGGLKEIGARLGPFDVAAIPIGAYQPPVIMKPGHTTPEEALRVLADVQGLHLVPIHWGTFDLAEEPLEEPPARLLAEARRLDLDAKRVWVLKHGETRRW